MRRRRQALGGWISPKLMPSGCALWSSSESPRHAWKTPSPSPWQAFLRALPAGLEELDLSWTAGFGDHTVAALAAQEALRVLKLRGCEMNDAGIQRLSAGFGVQSGALCARASRCAHGGTAGAASFRDGTELH